jgi:uncharacterized damage-inducible protein DinB
MFKQILVSICVALLAISCSNKEQYNSTANMEMLYDEEEPATDKLVKAGSNDNDNREAKEYSRKIIKEGDIAFETKDINSLTQFIHTQAKNTGGYIADETSYKYEQRIENRITVRIPADKFDEFLAIITDKAGSLDQKNIRVLDVTASYIDKETRIKSKKELEARYLDLLKQAKTVDEILKIEQQLGAIREDIEAVEAQLKSLKDKVSYSTLNITYYTKQGTGINFIDKLSEGAVQGWQNLLLFFVGLSYVWPFILIIVIIIFIAVRYERKRRKNI